MDDSQISRDRGGLQTDTRASNVISQKCKCYHISLIVSQMQGQLNFSLLFRTTIRSWCHLQMPIMRIMNKQETLRETIGYSDISKEIE